MIGTRNPTLDEAVMIVSKCLTKAEKLLQIEWMRIRFGDSFAKTVEARSK